MENQGTKILQTRRLLLRPFRESDAEAMFANWANDPEVTRYLTWPPHGNVEVTRALLRSWVENYDDPATYNWAIEHRGDLIGNISLVKKVDPYQECGIIGYCMGKNWWGKGIMTEALGEVLRYCFREVGFYRLEAYHAATNIGSSRVMEKNHLRCEGTWRGKHRLPDGERDDIILRAILRSEYESDCPSRP